MAGLWVCGWIGWRRTDVGLPSYLLVLIPQPCQKPLGGRQVNCGCLVGRRFFVPAVRLVEPILALPSYSWRLVRTHGCA